MSQSERPKSHRPRTQAVHGAREGVHGPMSTPVVHSATFSFESLEAMNREKDRHAAGAYYQRHGHPTIRGAEEALALLENTESSLLFASGMAAISAAFVSLLRPGDHVVALHQCYGGTHALLQWGAERFGWSYDLVDAREPESWRAAFTPKTRIFHVESPTNPTLCVVDLSVAAQLAHDKGALLTLDNTVASPLGQRGLALGADLILYSATKSIAGHSDLLAGAALGTQAALEPVWKARLVMGALPAPEVAWQIERSLKTMALRVEAANGNALELAQRLARHPGVARVFYPGLEEHGGHAIAVRQMRNGFGPLLSFDVRGAAEAAVAFANALRLARHAPSLGGAETLVSLPAHTSHVQLGPEGRRKAGIPEGLVRLSAGIEDVEDLWVDLEQALSVAAGVKV